MVTQTTEADMSKGQKVPVTMRALLQRINRRLAPDKARLVVNRGRADSTLGGFYVLDIQRNAVRDSHADPEALGRKLGALRAWEVLAEDER
jgi:hypothetical protein